MPAEEEAYPAYPPAAAVQSPALQRPAGNLMKVFVSWSGQISHKVAYAVSTFLPSAIQRVEPFLSTEASTRRLLNSLPWVYAHSTWTHGGLVRMFVAYRLLETQ